MPTTPVPVLLSNPGFLFWAPLGSSLPTFTVSGSKFTDAWPVAWLPLGATKDGSKLTYSTKVEAVSVAEIFDPIIWKTTERTGKIAMALASFTLANLSRAMNTGTITNVSGTGATALNKLTPPTPGNEPRAMIGFESTDGTFRGVAYQAMQGGDIEMDMPSTSSADYTTIPCEFNFEVPSSGNPVEFWSAGAARVGS